MAHNGGVENFSRIKRDLRKDLQDDILNWIREQTDSEHIFAHVVNQLKHSSSLTSDHITQAFEYTFATVKQLMTRHQIQEEAYLNMVFTNGNFIVASRYVTDSNAEPLTLYHSEGSTYVVEDSVTRLPPG